MRGEHVTIAVLGLGEAGRIFAQAFAQSREVVGYDPGPVQTPEGVTRVDSAAEAVSGADLVLSLTTARTSVSVAESCRTAVGPSAVYLDLNAASPQVKKDVEQVLGGAAHVVDGAVIGSVRQHGPRVGMLLSGRRSDDAAAFLDSIGTRYEVLGGEVGNASRSKLLRSIFMKGLGALIQESIEAGAAANEEEWMRQQIAEAVVGGHETVERLESGTRIHARRRSHELGDSLGLVSGFAGTWPVTTAAQERHLLLARRSERKAEALDALRSVPTAAIGDGGDRLGFAGSGLRPVWDCPQIAGPALTVATHAGDNYGIHQALKLARPGEVLVVSSEDGGNRALMGDLIAERAKAAGIAGIIIDGPVRDAAGIAESGLPVWASGTSAAGPFKHGPARLQQPVAIGNAVCRQGDIVVADDEGVLFLTPAEASGAAEAAEAVLEDEADRRTSICGS